MGNKILIPALAAGCLLLGLAAVPSLSVAAQPTCTTTAINLEAGDNAGRTVDQGSLINITGSVKQAAAGTGCAGAGADTGTAVTTGTVQIKRKQVGVPCDGTPTAINNTIGSGTPPYTITNYDTAELGIGTTGFRADYSGSSTPYKNSESPCVDLVTQAVTAGGVCAGLADGVYLRAIAASGQGIVNPGDTGGWSYTMEVKNCTVSALDGVKVQGGTSGWTTLASTATDPVEYVAYNSVGKKGAKSKSSSTTVTWTTDLGIEQAKTILVNVDGAVPNAIDGSILFLSGQWSAAYRDNGTPAKSDYTGRVALCVEDPASSGACSSFDPVQ